MKKIFKFQIIIGYENEPNIFYLGESITSRFILDGNFLEGFIALDYMIGYISNDNLHIIIYDETGECFQFILKMNGNVIQDQTVMYLKSILEEEQYCGMYCEEIENDYMEETYNCIAEAKDYCICL